MSDVSEMACGCTKPLDFLCSFTAHIHKNSCGRKNQAGIASQPVYGKLLVGPTTPGGVQSSATSLYLFPEIPGALPFPADVESGTPHSMLLKRSRFFFCSNCCFFLLLWGVYYGRFAPRVEKNRLVLVGKVAGSFSPYKS